MGRWFESTRARHGFRWLGGIYRFFGSTLDIGRRRRLLAMYRDDLAPARPLPGVDRHGGDLTPARDVGFENSVGLVDGVSGSTGQRQSLRQLSVANGHGSTAVAQPHRQNYFVNRFLSAIGTSLFCQRPFIFPGQVHAMPDEALIGLVVPNGQQSLFRSESPGCSLRKCLLPPVKV